MNRLRRILLLCFAITLILSSCDDILEPINDNPGSLENVDYQFLLPSLQTQTYYSQATLVTLTTGFVSGLIDALACRDILNDRESSNLYWGDQMYLGALKDASVIIKKSEEEGDGLFYRGLAKILMAYNYSNLTNLYGDIPFSEALQGSAYLNPKYDDQEEVYKGILQLINEGIEDLSKSNDYYGGDLVFDGDKELWIKTAYALKMRLHLYLGKKDVNYYFDILDFAENAITSLEEEATFQFGGSPNSYWSLHKYLIIRPEMLLTHSYFNQIMEGDPRRSKLVSPDPIIRVEDDLFWFRKDAAIPLITLAEVHFIKAEIMLRRGDSKEAVGQELKKGIEANMQALEVPEIDYLAYVEEKSMLEPSASMGADLEQIITEAHKSYYGHNMIGAWSNRRRTGYPSGIPLIPKGRWNIEEAYTERMVYPASEAVNNTRSVEAAMLKQGGGYLEVPLWIFD